MEKNEAGLKQIAASGETCGLRLNRAINQTGDKERGRRERGERCRKIEGRWETEHNREQDDNGITLAQFSPAGRTGLTLAADFFDITLPLVGFSLSWAGSGLIQTSAVKPRFPVLPNSSTGKFAIGGRELHRSIHSLDGQ